MCLPSAGYTTGASQKGSRGPHAGRGIQRSCGRWPPWCPSSAGWRWPLAELGHRRIGVISGPPQLTTTFDRLAGFRRGLEEAGVELPPDAIVAGDFSRESGERATYALFKVLPGMTAIFAFNDVMALGVLRALRDRRLRIPRDISIAGFDDIPIACDISPPLTSVRVPMAQMGEMALRMVVEPPRGNALRVEHLPTNLVPRASTGRARR